MTPLAALLLLLTACSEPSTEEPPPLWDELVFDGSVLVVPGFRWSTNDQGRWFFQNRVALLCSVRGDTGGQSLRIGLRGKKSAGQRFQLAWDGEDLAAEHVTYGPAGLTIEIPPGKLLAGDHELTLKRDPKSEKRASRSQRRSVFGIRFRLGGGEPVPIEAADVERYRQIADFLQHGVAGTGKERRSGLLFAGPARHALKLRRAEPGKLRLEPRNFSEGKAVFTFRGDPVVSAEVVPGGTAEIDVEIPRGEHEVILEVEGDPAGVFLWGMPRLQGSVEKELVPIVLVTLDTTRRDALGPYGAAGLTPVLDRLAEEATVYESAFSTAPWTLPSHASIFTGLYPSRHGAGVTQVRLPSATATLARLLRDRGYLTVGFSSGDLSSSRFGLAQGFHYYRNPDRFETPGADLAGYLSEILEAHGEEPLFLFVNYFDAHALYQAPEPFEEKLGVAALREKIRQEPPWDELLAGKMSAWRRVVEGEDEISPDAVAYLKASYLAEVAWVDHLLGRLFDQLRDLGLYDKALVVVTADHGELLGEGGFFSHGARLDPELVEIPLLVKWPGQRAGRRSERLTSLVDLFPTILAAAGVAAPASDGLSLVPAAGGRGESHAYVLLEEHEALVHPLPKNMRLARHLFGVQRPSFRQLVWEAEQSCARYGGEGARLRRDGRPSGWHGVECETEVAEVAAAIEQQLGGRPGGDEGAGEVPEELKEMLLGLGYMSADE